MWITRTGYSVARVMGRTVARFDTREAAEAFAVEQPFDTEIIRFVDEELV